MFTRKVYIEHKFKTYFVVYIDRKKYGRYYAAQFNDVDFDEKKVLKWIDDNPKIVYEPNRFKKFAYLD